MILFDASCVEQHLLALLAKSHQTFWLPSFVMAIGSLNSPDCLSLTILMNHFLELCNSFCHINPFESAPQHSCSYMIAKCLFYFTAVSPRRSSNAGVHGPKELTVPSTLTRSSSLVMLGEAFTAVHNLCVMPASAGKNEPEVCLYFLKRTIEVEDKLNYFSSS